MPRPSGWFVQLLITAAFKVNGMDGVCSAVLSIALNSQG
jgi:hypothetical protein